MLPPPFAPLFLNYYKHQKAKKELVGWKVASRGGGQQKETYHGSAGLGGKHSLEGEYTTDKEVNSEPYPMKGI